MEYSFMISEHRTSVKFGMTALATKAEVTFPSYGIIRDMQGLVVSNDLGGGLVQESLEGVTWTIVYLYLVHEVDKAK